MMTEAKLLLLKLLSRCGYPVVFICYRRRDSAYAVGRLTDRLVARFGRLRVFRDVYSIPLGVDFPSYIERVMGVCNVVLVVIGPDWFEVGADGECRLNDPADTVRLELSCAMRSKARVVPVMVGGAQFPAPHLLPEGLRELSSRHGMELRSDPDFHGDAARLLAGL